MTLRKKNRTSTKEIAQPLIPLLSGTKNLQNHIPARNINLPTLRKIKIKIKKKMKRNEENTLPFFLHVLAI